jgi:hypothetical protein
MDFNPTDSLFTADQAREASSLKNKRNDVNFKLTLFRLMKLIESSARNGTDFLIFEVPRFILDGSLADNLLLARQLKKKLEQLGYQVKKKEHVLTIKWN